jgi:hypothetical protein
MDLCPFFDTIDHCLPLSIDLRGRYLPVAPVRSLGDIGPGMVAMGRRVQETGIRGEKIREMFLEHGPALSRQVDGRATA